MTGPSVLRLAVLYPELLGTYGDGGNALVLRRRLEWRGFDCEVVEVGLADPVPGHCDLYVLGGGEDDAQTLAMRGLRASRGLVAAAERDAPIFAVCAGMQLLGTSFDTSSDGTQPGLGLLDVTTVRRASRAVGEVVARPDESTGLPPLTGFENHGGGTTLGPDARPLATVTRGVGNGAGEPTEGVLQGSIVATYLHGPVLARNPALADLLLERATGEVLAPLDSAPVTALRTKLLR